MMKNFLLEKIVLPVGDIIFKSSFIKSLKFWRKFDNYTELELKKYQEKQLKKQLLYAIKNLKKYKNIPTIKQESALELLSKFPILTKDDLRKNPKKNYVNTLKKTVKIYSSGSTGVSTSVIMDIDDLTSIHALAFHLWELSGYKIGKPVIQTGISPNRTLYKKLKDIFFNTHYVVAFALKTAELDNICNKLLKKRYTIIGYSSSINIIALHAIKNNYTIKAHLVICLGDKLFFKYRKNIEKAFQCKVIENYGSSEGFQIGFQVDLKYMYLFTPQTYLELLDDENKPVKDGEIGHVVVTRLDNKAMPLIRYKVGDLAIKLPKNKYPKKRKYNFPLLEKVVGRNTDIVILPDNRKMIVHSFTGIFEYINEIKQFKIIQKSRKGILIQYIADQNFTNDILITVREKLQEYVLDKNFSIDFEKVSEIKKLKSGKSQIIESFLEPLNK